MKRNLLCTAIFAFVVIGCRQQERDQALKPSDQVLSYGTKFDKLLLGVESVNSELTLTSELKVESQGIVLPVGTVLQKVDGDPTTLLYTLPSGYKLAGQDASGKARMMSGGSITCTCNVGRGCSPYVATLGKNQSVGCAATGNCSNCTMTRSGGSPREVAPGDTLSSVEIINFNIPIHFVTTKEELKILSSPSSTMMSLEKVSQQLLSFAKGYQVDDVEALNKSTGPSDLPRTYSYLHVNLYGKLIMLPVQTDLTLSANPLLNELVRESSTSRNGRVAVVYKCTCSRGSGCSLNSGTLLFAKAIYCDAGSCQTCTLSWI